MKKPEKGQISKLLETLLVMDIYLTEAFVKSVKKFLLLKQPKLYYILQEMSLTCNAMFCLAIILISIWIFKNLYQMQVNLVMGLMIDSSFNYLLKIITRRERPPSNHKVRLLSAEKYSFPSGHASRAMFIAYFFLHIWPVSSMYILPLVTWSFSICMSRLLTKRHHIFDVLVGGLLGFLEGLLVHYIYLQQETCIGLISWIVGDKIYIL